MKAIIEFIIDDDMLSEDELKDKLLNKMANACDEWINGNGVLIIDIIIYEDNKQNINDKFFINKSIN